MSTALLAWGVFLWRWGKKARVYGRLLLLLLPLPTSVGPHSVGSHRRLKGEREPMGAEEGRRTRGQQKIQPDGWGLAALAIVDVRYWNWRRITTYLPTCM